jgi:O-antigen/teichoic acid export membrane protein
VTPEDAGSRETRLATSNALKLGGSLLATWGIAMAMRFLLPRYLGPQRFGALSFADAFAATSFIVLGFGVDLYIRKHVSIRPAHASDFFGGTFLLRVAMSALILMVMAIAMHAMDRPPEIRRVVYVFGVAQFFVTANATLSALLHARGRVGGMSVLAIATKIVWALGVLLAIAAGAGLWGFAFAFLVSEAIESVVLFRLAQRHLDLAFRIDVSATKAMVLFSLPYYLNTFATTAYGKLDVTVLAVLDTSLEVGFYAAASAIAGLSLLVTPLIGWVLMPTLARAAARSHDEFFARIRGSTELILGVAIPVALILGLGADVFVRILFGEAFAPAALALRILAPTFVVTYMAIIFAITLLMLERAWTLTAVSVAGLAVNLLLNVGLIGRARAAFGAGGGGAGCALAMLGTEVFVAGAMMSIVGRRAVDHRTLGMVAKSLAACALVVLVDHLAAPMGWARLVLDASVYLAVVILTGALRVRELAALVVAALRGEPAGAVSGEPPAVPAGGE